jgi:hypothetical protein
VIAAQFELKDALELRRAVRRLKEVLKSEGIRIPIPEDYGPHVGAKLYFWCRFWCHSDLKCRANQCLRVLKRNHTKSLPALDIWLIA